MPVNFEQAEERKKYIESKFSDLLENINSVYGKGLMERLIIRLEKTIELFDQDVQKILRVMDDKEKKFEDSLPKIDKLKSDYIKFSSQKKSEVIKEEKPVSAEEDFNEEDDEIIKKIQERRKKK